MRSPLSLLSKLLARTKPDGQEALLIFLKLSDEQHGLHDERESLFRLEDDIIKAIDDAEAGEFDGNEFGEGFCTLYLYGASALSLWEAVGPVLKKFPVPEGSYAIKRYGNVGAREERVVLPE